MNRKNWLTSLWTRFNELSTSWRCGLSPILLSFSCYCAWSLVFLWQFWRQITNVKVVDSFPHPNEREIVLLPAFNYLLRVLFWRADKMRDDGNWFCRSKRFLFCSRQQWRRAFKAGNWPWPSFELQSLLLVVVWEEIILNIRKQKSVPHFFVFVWNGSRIIIVIIIHLKRKRRGRYCADR